MAAPKSLKFLGGAIPTSSDLARAQYDPPATPLDDGSVLQAVQQLQNTVNELIARHNGVTNGVVYGALVAVDSTTTKIQTSAGEVVIGGVPSAVAATTAQNLPGGATTGAGQFCNVLVEIAANGTVTSTAGALAASAGAAVTPAPNAARATLAVIAIPASFTVGTTPVTAGMITNVVPNGGGSVSGAGAAATNLFTTT